MKQKPSLTFDALGTQWVIEADAVLGQKFTIHTELDRIENTWSRFRHNSLVADMQKKKGVYKLQSSDVNLMHWYEKLYKATNGLVTPLIGQTLVDAGYDKNYSLHSKKTVNSASKWEEVVSLSDDSITIKKPALLDVGAAGKGYAVDQVARLLEGEYCIDASGDILIRGEPMRIGLQDPMDPAKLIGVATIQNESICGSAVTRRAWGDWHHIINPKTTKPVEDIVASWVIAGSAMIADGLATALFFVEPEKLNDLADFEYCIIYRNGSVKSAGSKIELFTVEGGQ